MNLKTEGTFVLEGLIEGTPPRLADFQGDLDRWIRSTAGRKLRFGLETEGNSR